MDFCIFHIWNSRHRFSYMKQGIWSILEWSIEIQTPVRFLAWEYPLERVRIPIPVFLGFPGSSPAKESACNAGDLCLIPGCKTPGHKESDMPEWLSRSLIFEIRGFIYGSVGKESACNAGDMRDAHSISRSGRSPLGGATHCSSFAWKIPRTEETGGLLPMWSQRVWHK